MVLENKNEMEGWKKRLGWGGFPSRERDCNVLGEVSGNGGTEGTEDKGIGEGISGRLDPRESSGNVAVGIESVLGGRAAEKNRMCAYRM